MLHTLKKVSVSFRFTNIPSGSNCVSLRSKGEVESTKSQFTKTLVKSERITLKNCVDFLTSFKPP